MPELSRSICPRCQIGQLRTTHLPYAAIESGQLVCVPSMPALACDVCGHRIFQREPVKQLYVMLGAARHRRGSQPPPTQRGARPDSTAKDSAPRTPRTKKP
ncbi:MAG: hypothetical protein IT298_05930 [Chloroflexi bacterium]|jgi:hypothetical protein|nr:MAG: hypothetical protein UZ13_03373 [Chloroflexi bacterium OLB13]MBV6436565.1 hypothetical protein [Anaerolineae bacterium]MCC6565285.1 hypothetical protein [Chloroflexota bacterium]MDL1916061.1 hypothetical protein [Anaerolineae bacterium CFX4]MBW7879637.1 hypothetical protein [Anaerolineae bacterium]